MKKLTKKEIIEFIEHQKELYKKLQNCYQDNDIEYDRYFTTYIALDYIVGVINGEIERVE
jgi:hypothetical protein